MNIREIERLLNMPRANIRYYEREGLLHPARSENNYRDYSEEDVEALKKIRLLRQLGMPVDTIRSVQAGEISLEAALVSQSRLLESEAARLERSQTICRSMLDDRVTYPALDPGKYEAPPALDGKVRASQPVSVPPVEGAVWAYSPWQRFWARSLDLSLAGIGATLLLVYVFHISAASANGAFANVVSAILSWGLLLLAEPLLLHTWGTTPGKWLLGLELRDAQGEKLRYSEGIRRTWGVLGQAYGYSIPFYNLYRYYRAYQTCRSNCEMDYDAEEGYLYYSKPGDRWGARAAAAVFLSLALLTPLELVISYQVMVPPNRGEVTKAEYFENVNYLAGQLGYSLWLDGEGRELADWSGSVSENGGPIVTYEYGKPISEEPVFTVETDGDGYVTAVCLEQSGGGEWAALPAWKADLAFMALAGTEEPGLKLYLNDVRSSLLGSSFADDLLREGSLILQGGCCSLTIHLEQSGYTSASSDCLFAADGAEEPWYCFTFRLERAG